MEKVTVIRLDLEKVLDNLQYFVSCGFVLDKNQEKIDQEVIDRLKDEIKKTKVRMNTFSCRSCRKNEFMFEQMKKERKLLSNNRGICKPCYAEYAKLNLRLKRARENPKEFLTCDNCDGLFSIYNKGPTQKNGIKKLKTECPYCKSDDINRH